MKIRTKLSIVAFLSVLVIAILMYITTNYVSKNIVEVQIGNHLLTTAQSRAKHIETLLNDYKETVQVLTVGIPFTNSVDQKIDYAKRMGECNLRIEKTINFNSRISRIRILNKNGMVIASSHEDIGYDLHGNPIFINGKENVYVGEIHKSIFTEDMVINISAPIMVRDKFEGILIVNYNVNKELFQVTTDKTGLGKTGEIYLVNKDGYMITPSRFIDDTILKTKVNTEQANLCFSEHIEKGLSEEMEEQPTSYLNYRGERVFGTHFFIPEMQWCLIAEMSYEEAYGPMTMLTRLMIIIFLIFLGFSIIAFILVSKFITKPIERLRKGTEEIISGNLDYKVGTKARDEIGQLSRAFDSMSGYIKNSREELQEYSEGLEQKVKERTAELNEKIKESEKQRIATFNLAQDLEEVNISLRKEISKRKRAEEEIKASQEQLRNLSSHLQSVREEERTNLAHDIHDVMGSALTALKMDVSLIEKGLTDEQFKEHERINSIKNLISETIKNVQKIAAELRPGILDDFGLTMAIEWQAEEFEKRSGMKCEINIVAEEIILDGKLSTAVFRIFQESLTNVARHSKADKVKVDFVLKKDELKLTIVDNGIGIKDEEIKHSKSIGLLGMQERVYPWKGSVGISGIPGEGTSVKVSIPLK